MKTRSSTSIAEAGPGARSKRMEFAGNGIESEQGGLASKRIVELEGEVALYRHALEKSREEMQAFAYSVSHDLRAPLRAIEGFSKILLEDFSKELGADAQRFLQHIVANTQTLGSQLDDLLRLYRSTKTTPAKVAVNADAVCREAASAVADGKRLGARIEQERLPEVMADPVQLRIIFTEMLSNALKAVAQRDTPRVHISARQDPGAVTFSVQDNGAGFDEKSSNRLFQVFQKLHTPAEFPGNGIGLAIVKRLVEAHGGCVSARSPGPDGDGAVFSFTLPS